jgi:hypothetical protein
MRIIYNTCLADPWLKVAQKLKQEHGWEPVYWNGYTDDDSDKLVAEVFPNCIYHPYFDGWKGVFPVEIEEGYLDAHIAIDFLKNYSSFELQAIKMMDRMDTDRYSFNFMERQRHYRRLLKYCMSLINICKPDVVICDTVPHRLHDFVLLLLCQFYKIKYIAFRSTNFFGYILPVTRDLEFDSNIDFEYIKILNSNLKSNDIFAKLNDNIKSRYLSIIKQDNDAIPYYMKDNIIQELKSSSFLSLSFKFITDLFKKENGYFNRKKYIIKGFPTYYKKRSKSIEGSKYSLMDYVILKLKTNSYKKKLKKYYQSKTTIPDLNLDYLFFSLHYQPEMTTSPCGDIFVDQLLCIESLLKYLPKNYLIYVKEHPMQFYSHREGHTSRIKEFYNDLIESPRVKLVPLNFNTFELIKNAEAVSTVSGTTGWEAMVLGKPVISFGLSWYERYYGTLKIINEKSASKISEFINDFKFDKRNLYSYLLAFERTAIEAQVFRGRDVKFINSEEECVENLSKAIISFMNNKD